VPVSSSLPLRLRRQRGASLTAPRSPRLCRRRAASLRAARSLPLRGQRAPSLTGPRSPPLRGRRGASLTAPLPSGRGFYHRVRGFGSLHTMGRRPLTSVLSRKRTYANAGITSSPNKRMDFLISSGAIWPKPCCVHSTSWPMRACCSWIFRITVSGLPTRARPLSIQKS
jgi:hypothetical protein